MVAPGRDLANTLFPPFVNLQIIQQELSITIRHSLHWGGSPQDGLGDEQTCGMTLASAYVLCRLSVTWLQL